MLLLCYLFAGLEIPPLLLIWGNLRRQDSPLSPPLTLVDTPLDLVDTLTPRHRGAGAQEWWN